MSDDYLSVKEAAARLDLSESTVRSLIQKGELEGAFQAPNRAWLIPVEAVSKYKAENRKPAARQKRETSKKESGKRETSKKETSRKSKDEQKKTSGNKKKTTKRRSSRKSSGLGLDDVVELLTRVLQKSDKPESGGLLTTLLQQFAGQKRSGEAVQLQSLLANLGEQDPDLLQEVLKAASVPDLASLLEQIQPQDE